MVNSKAQQQLYTHAAEPKAVQQRRAKVSMGDVTDVTSCMYALLELVALT